MMIRAGENLALSDIDMPQPDSGDSYDQFCRDNRALLEQVHGTVWKQPGRSLETRQARQQAEWEEARRQRQQAREAEAERRWQAEDERRKEAKEASRAEWVKLSTGFAAEPMVLICIGPERCFLHGLQRKVQFEATTIYIVPQSVADLLVRDRRAAFS